MKRTAPLLITASVGFVLIIAFFIPQTESWGEIAAIWFDILASIAFVLGGGNLLKTHLKKISDRTAGWAYSAIIIVSFVVTLWVGLVKWGSPPAPRSEDYGQSLARVPRAAFPRVYTVDAALPEGIDGWDWPRSARQQLVIRDGLMGFRGWMSGDQMRALEEVSDVARWQAAVDTLHETAQPPAALRGKVDYLAGQQRLAFSGVMTDADRQALDALGDDDAWRRAVEQLYEASHRVTTVTYRVLPAAIDEQAWSALGLTASLDKPTHTLRFTGPMSVAQRNALARQFPVVMPAGGTQRRALTARLNALGPLTAAQQQVIEAQQDAVWTAEQFVQTLEAAGRATVAARTARQWLEAWQQGDEDPALTITVGKDEPLSDRQRELVGEFVDEQNGSPKRIRQLAAALADNGPWPTARQQAFNGFFASIPLVGEWKEDLAGALIRTGPLSDKQRHHLLVDYRKESAWNRTVERLFHEAHRVRYPWSGDYRAEGAPFWWLYEYAFKPLTATMFAMLAFYVASAAFRAFRAKNLEAILLLGTAFIILLGRTFAGVLATSWLPDYLSALRIENLTIIIMSVFNTAGNRAIMIGIALGIASLSLKVMLGVDRSYLGSGED